VLLQFLKSTAGSVSLLAGILAVPVVGAAGIVVDYTYMHQIEANLQDAVDNAALTTAREMGFSTLTLRYLKIYGAGLTKLLHNAANYAVTTGQNLTE